MSDASCGEVGFLSNPGDLTDEVAYHSPERVRTGKSSPQDDTWALGVLLYQCATGALPFPGTNRQQVAVSILRKPIATLARDNVADGKLRDVLGLLLIRDVERRIGTVSDLRARLVDAYPELARLRPLGLGEPLEGLPAKAQAVGARAPSALAADEADEDEDDQDIFEQTALFTDDPDILRARMVQAQQRGVDTASALQKLDPARDSAGPAAAAGAGGQGSALAAIRAQAQTPMAGFDIEDPPTVQVDWRSGSSAGPRPEEPEASHKTAGVFDADAVFGPPVAPATADFGAFHEREARPARAPEPSPASSPVPGDRAEAPTRAPKAKPPEPEPSSPVPSKPEPEEPAAPRAPAPVAPPPQAGDRPAAAAAQAVVPPVPKTDPAGTDQPETKSTWLRDLTIVLVLTIVGGVVGFLFLGKIWGNAAEPSGTGSPTHASQPPSGAPSSTASTAAVTAAQSAPTSDPVPTADASASSSSSEAPTASAGTSEPAAEPSAASGSGATAAQGDVTECVVSTFAEGTFPSKPPSLDFVCTETDAYKGGVALRVKVIRAGGKSRGVTEGMKEWSMLGWYEMAAFVTIRGACCTDAPPLRTQPGIKMCPLDEKLTGLAKAVKDADDPGMEEALKDFMGVLRCLVAAGVSRTFGQPGPPDPGAVTVFRSTLERARKRTGH